MSQQLVSQTIKKFQDKLLDLSARNKLLNFKFSERARTQIRIVNDAPYRIYKRLNDGSKLVLETLPEPNGTPPGENSEQFQQLLIEMRSTDEQYQSAIANDDESPENLQAIERLLRDRVRATLNLPRLIGSKIIPTPQQQAQGLRINPAYDLPSSITDGMSSNLILQTLLFPKEFERKASRLLTDARTSIQETGRNTLYLAFGMLEWFESESSDVRFISPLLLYPVIIERESENGQYRYFVSAHEDEVEVNPCLRERLKRDFGIELPDFQEANSPDTYFREVARLIEGAKRWQVRRFVTLSLFSFGNFALYKDIDPENWANDGLASHPIVSSLLGGGNTETHDTFKIPSDYEVDKPDISCKVPLIISETDASQFSAIVDVMDGKNLVIEGPPGTGKSQTITNLIAAALAKGKTVLFVAEKMAAVEVVRARLDAVGLRDFCLEIHSTNKPKVDVYQEIKARWERGDVTKSTNPDAIEHEYLENRQQLTDYVELLNQPFGKMRDENKIHTIQEIFWRAKSLQKALEESNIPRSLLAVSINNSQSLSRSDLDKNINLLIQFCNLKNEVNGIDLTIWKGINASDLSPIDQERLLNFFKQWNDYIAEILDQYQLQAEIFNLSINPKLGDLLSLNNLLAMIPELPDQIEPDLLRTLSRNPSAIPLCRLFLSKYEESDQLRQDINRFFKNEDSTQVDIEGVREFISILNVFCQERQLSTEQPILSQVEQLLENDIQNLFICRQALISYQELKRLLNITQDLILTDLNLIDSIFGFIENTPDDILRYRNPQICDLSNRNLLNKAASVQKQLVNFKKYIRLELCQDIDWIRECAENYRSIWLLSLKFGQLWETSSKNFSFLQKILPSQEDAQNFIEINQDLIHESIIRIDDVLSFLERTPDSILYYLNPAICNPSNCTIIDQAGFFQKQASELRKLVRIELCRDIEWVRFCASKLRKKPVWILSFFDSDLHKAKELWVKVGVSLQDFSDIEVADILDKVADFWEQWNTFLKREKFNEIIGNLYSEIDTNLSLCYQVNEFGMRLEEVISSISCSENIKKFILNSSTSELQTAIAYRQSSEFKSLLQACKTMPNEDFIRAKEFWEGINITQQNLSEFRREKKSWKNVKISQQNLSDLEIADTLITVTECLETYNNLLSENKIAELDTNYALAVQVNEFGSHLEGLLSGISCANEVRDFFVNSSKESLQTTVVYRQNLRFRSFLQDCERIRACAISLDKTLPEALTILENQKQESEQIYQNLLRLNLNSDLSFQELYELLYTFNDYQRLQEELNSPLFTNVFGAYLNSGVFSPQALQGSLDWVETFQQNNLPENIKSICLSPNVISFVNNTKEFLPTYQLLIQKQEACCNNVLNIGKIDRLLMFGHNNIQDCHVSQIREKLQSLDKIVDLQMWISYSNIKMQLESLDLMNFVNSLENINITEEQLDLLYRTIFYRSLVNEIYRTHARLRNFEGQIQQTARQKFQNLDRKMLKLYQGNLAVKLSENKAPEGIRSGSRKTWTEKSLIKNEIDKHSRFVAIRDLFNRAGRYLQSFHPCWMMSPASVAQFLPSNSIRFDLIVIDEASQMRPEEALGVIARGKQLIVVGDPKQLPPTSFFMSVDQVDEFEDVDSETLQEESILDMAMKMFSVRRLKWHYRSRHESLIAFSNKYFYDNSLTVFPSPNRKFAINYHHIADGLYKSGVNPIEVRKVAEAILEFMKNSSELSLGVVTLNQKQRDLLQDEMSLLVNNHPEVADYIAKWEATLSSFFIKNLENVQGDERDVIFISTVYGRERPDLPVAQRFGPINSANGHRRLNVLFTRAKERIEVFSSMTAPDIRPTESSNRGVHALRDYLEYIQTQQLETARLTGREPDSDFEVFVAKAIRAKGFEVVAQVGVANYFIDLAIVDPNRAGTYLLGIECDGATYHSSKAARDRDRYRQEVLEKLGWKLYRIWSTDWFKNPDVEIQKLLEAIEKIVKPSSNLQ
jgi:superfamily I DNA and/or RNA helicase/very-short-patch-repair endonuclease